MKQILLFTESELWKDQIKPLSDMAKMVWRWMTFRGGESAALWWRQIKMAVDLRIPLRSLQRYIGELVTHQVVVVTRRGRTSAVYKLLKSCESWRDEWRIKRGPSISESPTDREIKKQAPAAKPAMRSEERTTDPVWHAEFEAVCRREGRYAPDQQIISALEFAGLASGNDPAGMAEFWARKGAALSARARNALKPLAYVAAAIRGEFRCA